MNYVASLFTTETNISNLFLSPLKYIKYLSHELYYLPSESLTSNLQTALGFCQRSSYLNGPLEDELMYAFIILEQTVLMDKIISLQKKFLKELFRQSKKLKSSFQHHYSG